MKSTIKPYKATPQIGQGVFLASDIAKILKLPYSKVNSCMKGFWQSYTFGEERNKAINFHSLIEFYIFYQLRSHDISAQSIKKVHTQMSKELNTPYPFAHNKISADKKKRVYYEKFDNLIRVDCKKQMRLAPMLEGFLHKLRYGKDHIAEQYFPLEDSDNVVIDPKHQFGQPTITGTNIKTQTIYSLFTAGEKIETISNLYNIPLRKVEDAVTFHNKAA